MPLYRVNPTRYVVESTHSVLQSIGTGLTAMLCNTDEVDDWDMHDTSSLTSRFLAPVAGRYHCQGSTLAGAVSAGVVDSAFRINGTSTRGHNRNAALTGANNFWMAVADVVLAAGEYAEFVCLASGGAVNTVSSFTRVSMRWVGPI